MEIKTTPFEAVQDLVAKISYEPVGWRYDEGE